MNVDEVTCTLTYTGSNIGATNSAGEVAPSGTCTNAVSDPNPSDIWFSLTVPASGGFIYDDIVTPGFSSIVEVYTGTCGALTALDPVVCNSSGAEKAFEGLTPGDTVYLRYWDYGSNDEGALEFCIKPTPTCVAPSALTATAITDTSADLGWTEAGTATTWNVEWGVAPLTLGGGTTITGTTTNPESLTGLTAETDYQYYVQADCGGGDTSAWSGPYSFTTEVAPPACGGNFYDTGASTGNYGSSESYTITICPDISGDAVSAAFTSFLVEGDGVDACYDALLIYDGADNTATPITPASLGLGAGTEGFCWQGVGDGTADLTGQTITSSDASGCLTFTFTSDGSVQFSGWEAMIGCSPLSAQDIAFNDLFSYFPNPVNNNLTLTAQKDINNIAVYNMLGQEVLRTAPNTMNTEVNMSALQTGAYFVKVTIGNTTETVRVIKN